VGCVGIGGIIGSRGIGGTVSSGAPGGMVGPNGFRRVLGGGGSLGPSSGPPGGDLDNGSSETVVRSNDGDEVTE